MVLGIQSLHTQLTKGIEMNEQIEKLINDYQVILDRDPLSQSEDTYSILLKFTQALATELGEILVASPYNEGVLMYFDEKIARYEVKKAVGLIKKDY